jgi:hypothetical protein
MFSILLRKVVRMPDIDVMGMSSAFNPLSDVDLLEAAADQAIRSLRRGYSRSRQGADSREPISCAELENCVPRSRQVIGEESHLRHPRRCNVVGRTGMIDGAVQ